jgi:hypothetical protein
VGCSTVVVRLRREIGFALTEVSNVYTRRIICGETHEWMGSAHFWAGMAPLAPPNAH